jgi:hypothetical protein
VQCRVDSACIVRAACIACDGSATVSPSIGVLSAAAGRAARTGRVAYLRKCPGWSHVLWTSHNVTGLKHLDASLYRREQTLHGVCVCVCV